MEANPRNRRGVVRRSITRLTDCVSELEETTDQPRTPDHTRQLLTKLYFQLIDLIDEANTEGHDAEQGRLDKRDDDVAGLTVRLEALMYPATPPTAPVAPPLDRRPLTHNFARVQTGVNCIDEAITPTDPPVERTLLCQYLEETSDYTTKSSLLTDDDELFVSHSALKRQLYTTSH